MIVLLACSQNFPHVYDAIFNCVAKVRKKAPITPFAYTFEKVVEAIDLVMTNKFEQS